MITLYRKADDSKADEIEARFKDLVLSYKTRIGDSNFAKNKLPKIKDGDTIISGDQNIERWFRKLEANLKWERSLSGDGCYIDPESGDVC